VAVATGVFVVTGKGIGVSVAREGRGVKLGVVAPETGVALSKASTVCAAAVLAISSTLFEGRLHALRNTARMISKVNKRVLFFMFFSPSYQSILPQVKFWRIHRKSHQIARIKNRSCENSCFVEPV
jgi:hypothetical protein